MDCKKSIKNYRQYKPDLRKEFNHSCGYCGLREPELGGSDFFWIDHYKPQSKFPELIGIYLNLIYSCMKCNRTKGNYWHNSLDKILSRLVLNPRSNDVDKHIDKSHDNWMGLTRQGRWNINYMHLSNSAKIAKRRARRKIQDLIEENLKKHAILVNKLEQKKSSNDVVVINKIEEMILDITDTIDTLKRSIEGPMD